MSLTSPTVSGADLEGSTLALFNEFLSSYFDGGTHAVGPLPNVVFPRAVLRFQESPMPQPLDAIGISVVFVSPSRVCTHYDQLSSVEAAALPIGTEANLRQQRATAYCAWMFLIRAVSAPSSNDNSQKQVQSAAAKLYQLFQNNMATKPLAQKGIHHLRPVPPRMAFTGDGAPAADLGFKLRLLTCAGEAKYPIVSQPA